MNIELSGDEILHTTTTLNNSLATMADILDGNNCPQYIRKQAAGEIINLEICVHRFRRFIAEYEGDYFDLQKRFRTSSDVL